MSESGRFFVTTAIDYPNSLPHIGTAFEKLGADVQARYRRMQGHEVFFLMGNDENTVKVSRRAAELGRDVQEYCDDMARQFKDIWKALDISFDDFIQTSEPRHHAGCRKFIQKVYDNGHIYKGSYEGWYCEGCEEFKTDKAIEEAGGVCPNHATQKPIRRVEPCWFFRLSAFRDRLLAFYAENPEFIQPESRRNEVETLVRNELRDVNISRSGETWGIKIPFDEEFTIYVWFDALLNYLTAAGYGTDDEKVAKWWPADLHVIGKDITRFHCALWPAMCFAADVPPPKKVFGHGFVYLKNETDTERVKISKSGTFLGPMDLITKFNAEAFRYYFLSECPFPSDGEFTWERFESAYDSALANKFGNLLSRVVGLMGKNHAGVLPGTAGVAPEQVVPGLPDIVARIKADVEACWYHRALQTIWQEIIDPTNKFVEDAKPWSLFKTDPAASAVVLHRLAEVLRVVSILCKPFLPKASSIVYNCFNFSKPWDEVRYEDAATVGVSSADLATGEALRTGTVPPLFPRIETKADKGAAPKPPKAKK